MPSNCTRFNAKQKKITRPLQQHHIPHSSWIKFSIFCNLLLLASHVPTMSSALSCHFLFPLRSPSTETDLVFSWDYTRLIQQVAYTTFRQRKQHITDQCTKRSWSVRYRDEDALHYQISVRSESLLATLCTVTEHTYVNVGKRGFTCFPESRFKCHLNLSL